MYNFRGRIGFIPNALVALSVGRQPRLIPSVSCSFDPVPLEVLPLNSASVLEANVRGNEVNAFCQ